jgi:hypothetical protein
MDRREGIRRFIIDNRKIFFSNPFPQEVFKKLKRDFFLEHAKIAPPKDSEVASELLEIMVSSSQITEGAQLEKTLAFPFLRDNVMNKEYFRERINLGRDQSDYSLDVNKIKQAEEVDKVLEKLRAEAERKALENAGEELRKIQETIREHEERLSELRGVSILDRAEYSFPESDQLELDEETEKTEWWERLGLKADPFPELDQATAFPLPKEFLDAVTYRTTVFVDYQTKIENRGPDVLFQNTIFYGQFGSGKTHLFRYLEQKLILRGYDTIYLAFSFEDDLRSIVNSLRRQLYDKLAQRYLEKSGETVATDPSDIQRAIMDLLGRLVNSHGVKGIIVFLDDLHKGDLPAALDFINRLQPYTAQLRTVTPNIAFFIAGSLEMERLIQNDPKFSGSLKREEHMPPITADIACHALNKRFTTYARNPENPVRVERRTIERIFAALRLPTFRYMIGAVVTTFKKNDFEALTVDPIKIPAATLTAIKALLEENVRFKAQMNILTYGSKTLTAEQRTECLDRLCSVYNMKEFPDTEIRERDGAYFQALRRAHLIDARPRNGKTSWFVTAPFAAQARSVYDKFGLSPDHYLKKIYGGLASHERSKEKNQEIALVDQFASRLPRGALRDLTEVARGLHAKITETKEQYLTLDDALEVENLCSKSLASLTRAYQQFENLPVVEGESDDARLRFWKESWFQDAADLTQEYLRLRSNRTDRVTAIHAIELYNQAFSIVFAFIRKQYDESSRVHIPLVDLKNEEIRTLNESRNNWALGEYPKAALALNQLIERKIRVFLFDVFTLLYGTREERTRWIDPQSRQYIEEKLKEERQRALTVTANEFTLLNRGQYKLMMTSARGNSDMGKQNWLRIFDDIFSPWTEQDLYEYLNSFAESNVGTSHDRFEKFGADQSAIVYGAIVNAVKFISSLNRAYSRLLDDTHFRFNPSTRSGRFSFSKFSDESTTSEVTVDAEDIAQFSRTHSDKEFRVPLDDQNYVGNVFGLGYRKFFALLASLMAQSDSQKKSSGLELSMVSKQGSEVKFALTRLGKADMAPSIDQSFA